MLLQLLDLCMIPVIHFRSFGETLYQVSELKSGLPRWFSGKESAHQCSRYRSGFDPWVGKVPWSRKWKPTTVFLPGKFYGQRSLVVYSPWGHKESDTTEQLSKVKITDRHSFNSLIL